ncbi:hypothetical protein GDO78_007395 [Eleutherodactylus coqui]|uniref:Uncharacterized protein n=1 Tax=Eleutherodactylus coqui TaxID=57060 RepID=A0A8J6FIY5_ELECQ|nr:hypothetical protein GDO78_007395 [Eleutherodactylus coqui]
MNATPSVRRCPCLLNLYFFYTFLPVISQIPAIVEWSFLNPFAAARNVGISAVSEKLYLSCPLVNLSLLELK